MAYTYINRQGAAHYFKKTPTKKGGYRYYIIKKANDSDLIEEVPEGFEVTELPEDTRVVIRKIIPTRITPEEALSVRQAMERYSPVKDFLIRVEGDVIEVYISQFSHYFDGDYPTAEEAKKLWDENVDQWKRYDWMLSFILVEESLRVWSVVRKADIQYPYIEIERSTGLAILAEKYCYHVDRASLLDFWIPGEDW